MLTCSMENKTDKEFVKAVFTVAMCGELQLQTVMLEPENIEETRILRCV